MVCGVNTGNRRHLQLWPVGCWFSSGLGCYSEGCGFDSYPGQIFV